MYAELLTHNTLRVQTRTGKAVKKKCDIEYTRVQQWECQRGRVISYNTKLIVKWIIKCASQPKKKKKEVELEKANEIAGEHIPPRLSPRFIKKLPSPPPIFRSRRNSDNVPCLKIKLFFNGGSVVVQRFHCKSHVSKRRKQKGRVKIP